MKLLLVSIFGILMSSVAYGGSSLETDHAKKALEIYTKVISIPTVAGRGKVPEMAAYLSSELQKSGFSQDDIHILPTGETAAFVVRYKGDGSSGKDPILLLGHMDVVEAFPKDWVRPPFILTQDENYFYGRGTIDNKMGVTMLISTFIRLKKEGFVPTRDLVIAFSGDEETGMVTTRMLAYDRKDLTQAEFALNSDAGGGALTADGQAVIYRVQAAEKTYASFEITVRNPGGHSSRPRADNAIYELADALKKIEKFRFPVRYNDMTREYFKKIGDQHGGELGKAMIAFAENPEDRKASDRLAEESSYVGTTRTTCVATKLRGGHAENALPQSATATINCRIFPGVKVTEVKKVLQKVVVNDAVEFVGLGDPTESPVSQFRSDVKSAVKKAVHARYPDLSIMSYMESGGTDGMHFRSAGIPTVAISSVFMNPNEMYAHGLNERLPKKSFYDGLDHWTIILKELAGK